MKKIFFVLGIMLLMAMPQSAKAQELTDLITFQEIIDGNGSFEQIVKKYGFKAHKHDNGRFELTDYAKNCIVTPKGDIKPVGTGTSIYIGEDANMFSSMYSVTVFNAKAFEQLKSDFLKYARKTSEGYELTFADGSKATEGIIEEKPDGKGGTISWTLVWDQ